MADICDDAAVLEDFFFKVAQHNRKAMLPPVEATGRCLYCDEYLGDGRRWCEASCRDAWEKEQKTASGRYPR